MSYIGKLNLFTSGKVSFEARISPALEADELETAFRMSIGASAAVDQTTNIVSLAAAVMAKAQADKRRQQAQEASA